MVVSAEGIGIIKARSYSGLPVGSHHYPGTSVFPSKPNNPICFQRERNSGHFVHRSLRAAGFSECDLSLRAVHAAPLSFLGACLRESFENTLEELALHHNAADVNHPKKEEKPARGPLYLNHRLWNPNK